MTLLKSHDKLSNDFAAINKRNRDYQMTMRKLINLVEAKKVEPVDMTQQAQALYIKTKEIAKRLGLASYEFQKWDQEWANEFRAAIMSAKQKHEVSEQKEKEYEENYVPNLFNLKELLPEILFGWWQSKDDHQVLTDAKYDYERYQDDHPNTEASDEMSARQAEVELGKTIAYRGGLGSIESMDLVLKSCDSLADAYWRDSNSICISVENFITKGFPVMMTYAILLGAKK
jgi:hypothetical protein